MRTTPSMKNISGTYDDLNLVIIDDLKPKKISKHARDEVSKYFRKQYRTANHECDKDLISLINAIVTSKRVITVLTRSIFAQLVERDENWNKERKLTWKRYSVFCAALEKTGFFQVLHPYTIKAPMIIRLIDPDLRALADCPFQKEKEILTVCEEFRRKKDASTPSLDLESLELEPFIWEEKTDHELAMIPEPDEVFIDPSQELFRLKVAELKAEQGGVKKVSFLDRGVGIIPVPHHIRTTPKDDKGNWICPEIDDDEDLSEDMRSTSEAERLGLLDLPDDEEEDISYEPSRKISI